ncbi:MAG: hypothetical protein ACXVJ7_05215 [Acidimicrobiia bacterium]
MSTLISDRRGSRAAAGSPAAELVAANLHAAQCQLAAAREALIAARRRVVELENAVTNWHEFAKLTSVTRPQSN